MAHFAQLNENNVVTQVIVIDNKETTDAYGIEKEHIGAAFCEKLFGGTWKQTSYNGNIRKNYAGIGYIYRPDIDAFIAPQPYPSWVLDADAKWQPPIPIPVDWPNNVICQWDESKQNWVQINV